MRWLLLQALISADMTGTSLSTDMASRYLSQALEAILSDWRVVQPELCKLGTHRGMSYQC